MNKQEGWINIDIIAIFWGTVIVSACVGFVLGFGLTWLWDVVKPLLHSLTA